MGHKVVVILKNEFRFGPKVTENSESIVTISVRSFWPKLGQNGFDNFRDQWTKTGWSTAPKISEILRPS